MTVQEMIARQKQLVETARREGRNLTEEEQTEFENLQRDIDAGGQPGVPNEGNPDNRNRGSESGLMNEQGNILETESAEQRAIIAERSRIREISGLCQRFGMDPESYISRGDTMEQVRASVLAQLERNGAPL